MPDLSNYSGADHVHYFDGGEPNVCYEETRGLYALVDIGHNEPLRLCSKRGLTIEDFIEIALSNTNANRKQCDLFDKDPKFHAAPETRDPEMYVTVKNDYRSF